MLNGLRSFRLRNATFAATLATLALATIMAAACGGDDDSGQKTATAATGGGATTAAAGSSVAAAYPRKVTDLLGREVEIKARPKTVVGVSPSAVEFVYAVGGTVVGRSDTATFPEAAKQAKDIGTAYQPNREAILALKPDLIVADAIIHAQPALRKPLEELGVPVVFVGADSYQKVLDGLKLMGQVFDARDTADKAAADVTKARDDARAAFAGKNLSALAILADRDQTIYAAKDASYAGDIMKQVGITNPANAQPDSGPFPGYTAIAPEKMVQYNPDYLFTTTPAPQPAPRLNTLIPQIPPFKGLKAVTTPNHILEVPVELFVQAPGPRITEVFKQLQKALTQ